MLSTGADLLTNGILIVDLVSMYMGVLVTMSLRMVSLKWLELYESISIILALAPGVTCLLFRCLMCITFEAARGIKVLCIALVRKCEVDELRQIEMCIGALELPPMDVFTPKVWASPLMGTPTVNFLSGHVVFE